MRAYVPMEHDARCLSHFVFVHNTRTFYVNIQICIPCRIRRVSQNIIEKVLKKKPTMIVCAKEFQAIRVDLYYCLAGWL